MQSIGIIVWILEAGQLDFCGIQLELPQGFVCGDKVISYFLLEWKIVLESGLCTYSFGIVILVLVSRMIVQSWVAALSKVHTW